MLTFSIILIFIQSYFTDFQTRVRQNSSEPYDVMCYLSKRYTDIGECCPDLGGKDI